MRRILLVDDNEDFRLAVGEVLRNAGYFVQTAADGREALTVFRGTSFDLVITDLIMPGKEGIETIRELHEKQPSLKILAISGGGHLGVAYCLPMARRLGASGTLAKPFLPAEILGAVADLFRI